MQRSPSSRSTVVMVTGLCAVLVFGCASGTTTVTPGTGGKPGTGGNGSPGTGGNGSPGTGGNGSPGTGGSGSPGTGGNGSPGTGGSGSPGTGGNGSPGTGGAGPGTGGSGTPGTGGGAVGGAGASRACAPSSVDVLSDFEEGSGTLIKQGTPQRTGWWYVYPNPAPGGTVLTPTPSTMAVAAAPSGDTANCNKWALHSTASGFGTAPNNYVGFGASFIPAAPPSQVKTAYDVTAYTGISFKIKSGSGTPPAVYFEVLTKDSQPATSGGTAAAPTVDLYNTRGYMLNTPWIPTAISTTWQTVTIPFGGLIPRWVPAAGAAMACPTPGAGIPKCQAPKFNPANVLGIQFSMYQDPGFPKPAGSTAGTYDLWVDDVTFVKADMGLQTRPGFPLAGAGAAGSCTKPAGADAKFLVPAYNQWKATFASGGKVIRPENGNDTVSEGIAYGMLIAVNMNDQPLFDGLYTYWKNNSPSGSRLMTWCIPAGGNSCQAQGGGSATDADEDAAFALLQAGKLWGGTYNADAKALIAEIWAKDIDKTSMLPTGGTNYGNSTAGRVTNASYFAPAYYRAFAAAGDTNNWAGVVSAVYSVINGGLSGANGLFPAWCSGNCTAAASNGAATDMLYQYDSHRIPMRVGLDYCWNGATASAAQTYTNKTTSFFATNANAGLNGIGRIFDLYTMNGGNVTGAAPNSASIIGTAAVGAMASAGASAANKAFLDEAYQAVFDMATRGALAPLDTLGKTPYSYYNATVGMLTLLIMNGNFSH